MGYKEIEVGFPAASSTDFDFIRALVEQDLVPDDVTIQVLTQAREELIERTVQSLAGFRGTALVHLYNSTSHAAAPGRVRPRQGRHQGHRRAAARSGAQSTSSSCSARRRRVRWQYSPESFTGTELDYALEVCEAVMDVWQPTPEQPGRAEPAGHRRDVGAQNVTPTRSSGSAARWASAARSVVLSLHPHNDRGTAVAAAELGVMAGADRVEGCLFGNGERTGNVCLVTLALNLFSQGVDPGIDFSDIDEVRRTVEHCNQLPVHPRHPYGGELVYTAFSGSHQDAIKKGFEALERDAAAAGVPVGELPVGRAVPADRPEGRRPQLRGRHPRQQPVRQGRRRLRPQERAPPRPAAPHADRVLARGPGGRRRRGRRDLARPDLGAVHRDLPRSRRAAAAGVASRSSSGERDRVEARRRVARRARTVRGEGNGPIAAFVHALSELDLDVRVLDYAEHATGAGEEAQAASYLEVAVGGRVLWGCGVHPSIVTSSLRAIVSAVNRVSSVDRCPRMLASSHEHRLAVIGGDGIGPEVVAEGLKVLDAVLPGVERTDYDLGAAPTPGPARRCPTASWRSCAATTPSCSAPSATRRYRPACSSAGCCCGCASPSTTT